MQMVTFSLIFQNIIQYQLFLTIEIVNLHFTQRLTFSEKMLKLDIPLLL